ncbi:MAG: hypothetical protein JW736_08995, partial [Deltaproteobacteria bacterium]|nr:hypothetical protein [Deltaproteobacteria bacterium]
MENQLAEQDQTIEEQQTTIDRLHADLKLLKRTVFGSRRERYVDDPQQGFLFDTTEVGGAKKENSADQETEQPSIPKRRRTSKGRGRRVFPEFFPRTSVYHELTDEEIPEDLRNDPSAKRFFKKTSERLELTPAKLEIIEEYQEVIARDEPTGETTMLTAPKPAPLIDSYAGPGLLAYLTVSRFA